MKREDNWSGDTTSKRSIEVEAEGRVCPFMAGRHCLLKSCMAWDEQKGCLLLPRRLGISVSSFDQKLTEAAPLMYRTLLDMVKILEDTARDCNKCGPELWNHAQEVRRGLLDELIKSQLDLQE